MMCVVYLLFLLAIIGIIMAVLPFYLIITIIFRKKKKIVKIYLDADQEEDKGKK